MFHLLREEYQDAKRHIRKAKELYDNLDSAAKLTYCKVQKEFLEGCCLACEVPIEEITPSLAQRLQSSIKDQYTVSISLCIVKIDITIRLRIIYS